MSLELFVKDFNTINKLLLDKKSKGFSNVESIQLLINEELLKLEITPEMIPGIDVIVYNNIIKSNFILSFLHAININESDNGEYVILKYNTRYSNYYNHYKYARSLVLNREIDNIKVISYGFEKFYNVGEKGISSNDVDNKIKEADIAYMADKLDGVNITIRGLNEDVLINTTGSLSKKIQVYRGETQINPILEAEKFLLNSSNDEIMVNENKDIAFIYEMIGVHEIVVEYNSSFNGLHLIGGRKFLDDKGITSRMLTQDEIKNFADKYNVRYVSALEITSISEALDLINSDSYKGKEGVVVYVEDEIYKLKCDDYVLIHHLKMKKELKTTADLKQFLKLITPLVINDSLDDYIGIFKGDIPQVILDIATHVENELNYFNLQVVNVIDSYNNLPDSEFFKLLNTLPFPKEYKGLVGTVRKNIPYNKKLSNIIIDKLFNKIKTEFIKDELI